jgi:putative phage-type endonuclease
MNEMRISGSKAAAICGISPWQTPLEAYLSIVEDRQIQDNPAMYFGRKLEPIIRDRYQEITGRIVTYNDDPEKYGIEFQHPQYDFIMGSLDGISRRRDGTDNRVLEIKTARSRDAWFDGVPEYYVAQCQHYLACTGFQSADVAVLFGAADFEIYEIERDDELIDLLIGAEVDFWNNHVLPQIPPEPTTVNDINIRWPRSIAKAVEGDGFMFQMVSELRQKKDQFKALEKEIESIEFSIKAFLQENDTLTIDGKPAVTWKQSKDTQVFDKDNFIKRNYEIYKQFLITRPGSRRFLLKGEK